MIHIKHILAKSLENASKAKFYTHNSDIFLKYFDSEEQYRALILAGKFGKIEEIIKFKQEVYFVRLYHRYLKGWIYLFSTMGILYLVCQLEIWNDYKVSGFCVVSLILIVGVFLGHRNT